MATQRVHRGRVVTSFVAINVLECLERRRLLSVEWSPGINLPAARGDGMALSTGYSILLMGGASSTGATNTVYELDDYNDSWISDLALDQRLSAGGVGQTGQGGPIVTTGEGGYKYSSDIFVYGGKAPTSSTSAVLNYGWYNSEGSVTAPSMSVARSAFAYATDAATGDLYAIGGVNGSNTPLASAERYDPVADSWSAIAPMPQALYAAAGASDGFGHIFVFGGAHTTTGAASSAVYRYTIATNTWDTMASMPVAVRDGSAVDAPDGMIYFIGGKTASGAIANVESYNPAANTWQDETPLPAAVYGAAVAVDDTSNIEVIGGFNAAGAPVNSVYIAPITPGLAVPYTPTIHFDSTETVYDGQPQSISVSALGIDGMTPVDGDFDITYNGSTTVPTDVGTYNVLATFTSNDPDYLNTVTTTTFQIDQATPTITVSGGGTITYDGQPHAISATAIGVDGVTPVSGQFDYSYNGASTAPTNVGTYTAVASFTSNDPNYSSSSASTTITIPDWTIPSGVGARGASTTSILITWNPITIAPRTYNVYERHVIHDPKGSGATIKYVLVAGGLTTPDVTISVPTAVAGTTGHTYYVTSVDPTTGAESARSAAASAAPLFAPSLYGGFSYAPVGQTTQVTLQGYGNEPPTYALVDGPSTMSVNAKTGLVTYTPAPSEVGTVTATFSATNSVASATGTYTFWVVPAPAVTSATFVPGASPQVDFVFNENLKPGIPLSAVSVQNLDTSGAVDITGLSQGQSNAAEIALSGPLTDGNYRVTLAASGITDVYNNPLDGNNDGLPGGNFSFVFFVLSGDANQDRQVNTLDFNALGTHFAQSGVPYADGDFNSDGMVNALDFNILASKFGATLPAPPAGAVAASVPNALLPAATVAPSLFSATAIGTGDRDILN